MSKRIPMGKGLEAIVDELDYPMLCRFKWHSHAGYAYTGSRRVIEGRKPPAAMHRMILEVPDGMFVDHINGIPHDNRRENLRVVEHQENMFNMACHKDSTSTFKGVYWDKARSKWGATICKDGKRKGIGRYDSEVEAALAYNKKAIELFGEHARLNEIQSPNSAAADFAEETED